LAVIEGVDFSSARPNVACLVREGKRFAIRYTHIGAKRAKALTRAEALTLTDSGMRVVVVFEETAGHILGGAAAGTAAAQASKLMAEAAGIHKRAPHYFACDVDTHAFTDADWAKCAAYLKACVAVLGKARVGLYGDYRAIRKLRQYVTWLWQTYAWSRDEDGVTVWEPGVHLQQYRNEVELCGGGVDLDRALKPLYGQWGVNVFDGVDLKRAAAFVRSCDPIPYKMTVAVSRTGIDCSGMMSVALRSLRDEANVWLRLFGTGTIAALVEQGRLPFLRVGKGDASDFNIGVVFPWEMTSRIGHTAGTLPTIGGVESRGGVGVLLGAAARRHDNALFRHHYHMKGDAPTATTPTPSFPAWPGRVLRLGVKGEDVRKYQAQMRHRGWTISVDGDYGPATREVTVKFQREKKLAVDGEVGRLTWNAAFTTKIT
jgi:hypothetical protein